MCSKESRRVRVAWPRFGGGGGGVAREGHPEQMTREGTQSEKKPATRSERNVPGRRKSNSQAVLPPRLNSLLHSEQENHTLEGN